MKRSLRYRIQLFFSVYNAVAITLAMGSAIRLLRQSLALKLAIILWLISYLIGYSEISDPNIWLVFYVSDAAFVIMAAIVGSYLGFTGFFIITLLSSLAFTLIWFMQLGRFLFNRESAIIELGPLSKYPGLDSGLVLYIDYISYSFALLTSLISLCVYVYAFSYMRFEKSILNFLVYFKLFGWSMILLVMAGSWFTLLLGWELIGITSFLLINFWISKITTLKSAFKAFVFNKVSDAALIAAICINLTAGASYINSSSAFSCYLASTFVYGGYGSISYASALLLCLTIAACCKSAQFGFHFWLPDSMEAPVPASALIHSATLVSAGIYLLTRFNSLFIVCPTQEVIFAVLTAFTAFYGAIIASFQTDVKKILAYSTISHCGMLMFSIITHVPFVTIFYLFAHGFFKSINFMCVGNFIQGSNNYQDTSRMGRFFALFRFELYFFIITLFNLSSGPLLFCFFSKHWLIGVAYTNGFLGSLAVCFIYAAAFCGAFYSSKLLFECMLATKRAHHSVYTTHAIVDNNQLYRRSNALSRAAMGTLFLIAFLVLYLLWHDSNANINILSDEYSSLPMPRLSQAFFAVHVWFSIALAVLASCYVSFKRGVYSWLSSALVYVTIGLLCTFM